MGASNRENAFEDSTTKFYENIRNLVDSLKMKLKSILEKKRETESQYKEAFESMVRQTEQESQGILNRYFYAKKLRKREKEVEFGGPAGSKITEEGHQPTRLAKLGKFRDQLSIAQILVILDKDLIQKQMNLSQKLESSFLLVKEDIKRVFEELKTTILGEHGLEKIDEFFKEFFNKFQQEAMQEAEKYEKVVEGE